MSEGCGSYLPLLSQKTVNMFKTDPGLFGHVVTWIASLTNQINSVLIDHNMAYMRACISCVIRSLPEYSYLRRHGYFMIAAQNTAGPDRAAGLQHHAPDHIRARNTPETLIRQKSLS